MLGLLAVLVLMMTFTRCCSLVGIVRFRLLLLLCCCWSFVVVICSLTSLQNNPIVVQRILPAGMAAITGLAVLWMLYYSFRGGCKFAVVLRRLSTVSIKIGMATLRKSSVHSKVSALSTGESVANPSQSGPQPDDSEDDSLSDNNQGHHHHDASQSQVEGLSVSSLRVSDHRRLNLNMSHGYVHSGSGQASARVHPLVPSEPPALKEFELAETTTTVTAHPQPAGESSQQMGITPREPLLAQSLPPGPTGHGERTESHSVDANSDSELEEDTNAAEPAVCSLSEDSDQS